MLVDHVYLDTEGYGVGMGWDAVALCGGGGERRQGRREERAKEVKKQGKE